MDVWNSTPFYDVYPDDIHEDKQTETSEEEDTLSFRLDPALLQKTIIKKLLLIGQPVETLPNWVEYVRSDKASKITDLPKYL